MYFALNGSPGISTVLAKSPALALLCAVGVLDMFVLLSYLDFTKILPLAAGV